MRLLIVEDEKRIALPLKKALEKKGYAVDYAEDGKKGLSLAQINEYDCLILDLNLPEIDGIEIAKKLRSEDNDVPILMLTARSQQVDKLEGLGVGADDYLTKPFHFEELLLRIKALIKRNSRIKNERLKIKNLELDIAGKGVRVGDRSVDLNLKEFGILEYLLRNKGKIVSQEELLEHVWDREVDTFTQTVKTNIKTLRKKIDPEKKIIRTVRGAGYIIE
ncbi:MAG TPA: response regulator transcription factor [bacterium]|nr:response regulator transcription factor [bacterium]